MGLNENGDLRIDGSGNASGGVYNKVKINGSGRINGDLECKEFSINGSGDVMGNIIAEKARVNGSSHMVGDLKAEELRISGSADLGGALNAGSLRISGSTTVQKNVDARQIKIDGTLKASGDCSAEIFESNGAFDIGGLLNADTINVNLYGWKSRAREIGGGRISVSLGGSAGFAVLRAIFTLGLYNPSLEADLIEGDEILLENTTARIVRGNNITIGRGCNIDLVEYKGTCQKTDDAKIGEDRKI